MAFKRPLSVSPIRHDQAQDPSPKGGTCQICGDIARIVNYGALSCSSCKTFFRRQGFHSEVVFIISISILYLYLYYPLFPECSFMSSQ
jgi:hypothetical protein